MGTRHWAIVAAVVAACLLIGGGLSRSEVWSPPGGISATDTSQQVDFPNALGTLTIRNDDTINSIFVRLFECGETPGAATTSSLEIKPTEKHSFGHGGPTETGLGYCALTVICEAAGPCPALVEGGAGVGYTQPVVCPCTSPTQTFAQYTAAHCSAGGPPPTGGTPTPICVPPPANPAAVLVQCDPGGVNPPWNMVYAQVHDTNNTCDYVYQNCDAGFPCTPVVDFDSGTLPLTAEEKAVCEAELLNSGYCS